MIKAGAPGLGGAVMAGTCTVDAELFESLQQAIDFVAEHGGGVVYSEVAETLFAKSLKLPDNVKLETKRPAAA
jgi:hypothetical protein